MTREFSNKKMAWEIRENIGYLSFIDSPENRMNTLFFEELHTLTTDIIPTSNVIAIIISGSGRHFSSGANLDDLLDLIHSENNGSNSKILQSNYQSFQFFHELNIPVIAAIKGVCLGSALELALFCHIRICSHDAILGLPESGFGLLPGLGGIHNLMKLSGKAKAIELVLKGNTFNTSDALDWHIVDAVYPKKSLMNKAEQLAKLASANYRKYNKTDYLNTNNTPDYLRLRSD
jgi:enoyl-CoA hydratase/carnithine racemase